MDDLKYIYQCIVQALALEEADVLPPSSRVANLRYIKQQLSLRFSKETTAEAESRAAATVELIKNRL